MKPYKVIVAGPGKTEKTTLIKSICDITVVSAGRSKSDGLHRASGDKPIAMDVGRINVSRDMALYLFGCAARQRFDLLADTFSEGLIGLIVVIGGDDHDTLKEAAGVLGYFEKYSDAPRVVAATDLADDQERELRKQLEIDDDVPIVFCDVKQRASAKTALIELLRASRELATKEAS